MCVSEALLPLVTTAFNYNLQLMCCVSLPAQLFLVGDPVQLPATVISTRAQEQMYDMSLFKRLQVSDSVSSIVSTCLSRRLQ